MKNLPLLFSGIFATLLLSWLGVVLGTQMQFGDLDRTTSELEDGKMIEGETLYPEPMVGLAQRGKEVYVEMGCSYCHTQQVRKKGYGSDYQRGWGKRQSVARDYILQERVLLGALRVGQDLSNVGNREYSDEWHHLHFYNSQITSPGSNMPSYPFLYEVKEIKGEKSADALTFPEEASKFAPKSGYEVVPTARAKALVQYMKSLNQDYELPEMKFAVEE
jgi:cytochrome c oxidase cbb3-type subunit 2